MRQRSEHRRWLTAAGLSLTAAAVALAPSFGCGAREQLIVGNSQELAPVRDFRPSPAEPGENVPVVKVNTLGYPSDWAKVAMFNAEPAAVGLWRLEGERPIRVAYRPTWDSIDYKGVDEASGDRVWQVQFSTIDKAGRYVLSEGLQQPEEVQAAVAGEANPFRVSTPFLIQADPYLPVAEGALAFFRAQRAHGNVPAKSQRPCACKRSDAPQTNATETQETGDAGAGDGGVAQGDAGERPATSRFQPVEARSCAANAPRVELRGRCAQGGDTCPRKELVAERAEATHCAMLQPLCAAPQVTGRAPIRSCPIEKLRVLPRGGWYHGGRYGIYTPTAGPAVQSLAGAMLRAPGRFIKDVDALDELEWGVEWLLAMQFLPAELASAQLHELRGGFFSREAAWDQAEYGVLPSEDDRARFFAGIGTASTAKATAALAAAGRLYYALSGVCRSEGAADCERFDKRAVRMEEAARAGYSFLQRHPEKVPVDGFGSGHPLWDDAAAFTAEDGTRFNAAVQVWALTGDSTILDDVKRLLATSQTQPSDLLDGSWSNLARWGMMTLAECRSVGAGNACTDGFVVRGRQVQAVAGAAPPFLELASEARRRLFVAASLLENRVTRLDGYRAVSEVEDYSWGHNAQLLEKAELLARVAQLWLALRNDLRAAKRLDEKNPHVAALRRALRDEADKKRLPDAEKPKEFDLAWTLEGARDQLHWLLGRNPNGYSMMTGVGRGPERMYHSQWDHAQFLPPPGYVIAGPNAVALGGLSPNAPAKALLLEHDGQLWHTDARQLPRDTNPARRGIGWWAVNEGSVYYNGLLLRVLAETYRTREWQEAQLLVR